MKQQQQQQKRKKKNKSKTPVEFTFHDIDGKPFEETFEKGKVITRKLNEYIHPEDVLFRTHRYEFIFEKEKRETTTKNCYIELTLRKIPMKGITGQTENLPTYLQKSTSEYLMKNSVVAKDQNEEGTLIETTFEEIQKEKDKNQWKLDLKWVPSSRCKWHNISMPNIPYFIVVSVFEHDRETGNYIRKSRFRSNLFQIVCKPRVYFNRTTKIWTQEQIEQSKKELEQKIKMEQQKRKKRNNDQQQTQQLKRKCLNYHPQPLLNLETFSKNSTTTTTKKEDNRKMIEEERTIQGEEKDIYLYGASYSINQLPKYNNPIGITTTLSEIDQWPTPDFSLLTTTPDGMILS